MRDRWRADELDGFISFGAAVEVVEKPLAATEEDGHDRQVQFVDHAGAEILLDGGGAPANSDVLSVCRDERSVSPPSMP